MQTIRIGVPRSQNSYRLLMETRSREDCNLVQFHGAAIRLGAILTRTNQTAVGAENWSGSPRRRAFFSDRIAGMPVPGTLNLVSKENLQMLFGFVIKESAEQPP